MSSSPPPSFFPPLRPYLLPAAFLLACFLALVFRKPGTESKPIYWTIQGSIFGTTYLVKVRRPSDPEITEASLRDRLHHALRSVDLQMSTYKKTSELSRFNASPRTEAIPVSLGLFRVLEASLEVSRLSGGAFDVTIGPIVNAWGFGPRNVPKPPSADLLQKARSRVGWRHLHLDPGTRTIRKAIPNLYIDLSAIAKGYAVDILAEALEKRGIFDYMAEIGGEVRTRGTNPQGEAWRIGIETPTTRPEQRVHLVVPLRKAAMATSGNYRNYRLVDGRHVSHLIDARTSEPVSHSLSSVSVVHPTCMMADALATALYVLGPKDGLRLATEHGWAALFLIPKASGFQRLASPAFQALMESRPNAAR